MAVSDLYEVLTYVAVTPLQWIILLAETCGQLLSDRMVLALLCFLLGAVAVVVLQGLVLIKIFRDQATVPPPTCLRSVIKMPEVLKNRLNHQSLRQKEDCIWLNFLAQFLFAELRDSVIVRRFLTKRIHKEFEEVLTSRTGVFVDELFLRDFNLGSNFPVFVGVSVDKCEMKKDLIETLDIRARMQYSGGFEIAIDAALPFGRTAYISVKVLKLKGNLRFQFTSTPFCHWSISFFEEPEMELDVSAQLDGRPMNKLKNIIASQVRRTLRKKHTLPSYKIRYKPFFYPKIEKPLVQSQNLLIDGTQIGSGVLEVTIANAARLPVINKDAKLYCTISVDELPWKQLVTKERLRKPVLRKELIKTSSDQSLGLTVKDELVPDRLHPVVVVEQVAVGSPSHLADIKEGDIIISVSGNKVVSAKQATKFLRSAKDKVSLLVETTMGNPETRSSQSEERISRRHSDVDTDSNKMEANYLSGFVNLQPTLESSASTLSVPSALSSSMNSKKWNVKKTKLINSVPNPSWDQKFIFTVHPNIAYLNVCVWSHGGDRSGRSDVIGSSNQDVLIGYASLSLDDIFLHCLGTLSGTLQDKVKLKHGQYQTEAELTKEWASHKGWDPELMYGDLMLAFYFTPSLLTTNQRKSMASCRSEVMKKRNSPLNGSGQSSISSATKTKNDEALFAQSPTDDSQVYSQGHHQFDSTSFVTATFCDYCGKKIWMKEAFKCRTCNMVCHKKCLVKCLVNTFCTDGGVKKRSAQDEKWEPSSRPKHADSMNQSQGTSTDVDSSTKQTKTNNEDSNSDKNQVTQNGDGSDAEDSVTKDADAENAIHAEGTPHTSIQRQSDISNTFGHFRNLKDRTDKIKDNVLRNLKKAKVALPLSDKDVLEAKDHGAKLFMDMEPAQRKDKLDDLITHLDEQLKLEMKNKESFEKELAATNQPTDGASGTPASKKRSEMKALEQKIVKSTEKLDSMRLLMLQYCTALQFCINMLEQDEYGQRSESSTFNSPQGSRVSYMGGIVKRASSSVKEKMSSIRKDFGKKGAVKPFGSPQNSASKLTTATKQMDGKNNNRLLTTIFDGLSSRGSGKSLNEATDESRKKAVGVDIDKCGLDGDLDEEDASSQVHNTLRLESLIDGETLIISKDDIPSKGEQRASSLPRIKVNFGDFSDDLNLNNFADSPDVDTCRDKADGLHSQYATFPGMDSRITRSNSDSRLEINKMVSLNPDDILRYHGNSLPKILVSEDENSESDFLLIDSSDENNLSDFYEDDRFSCGVEAVGNREDSPILDIRPEFVLGRKLPHAMGSKEVNSEGDGQHENSGGEDEDYEDLEHRGLSQESHSYVV